VLKLSIAKVRGWIREHPEASIISVSQNDTGNWCQCEQCKALDDAVSDGACVHGAAGLVPTDTFAGRRAVVPLALAHFPGWFLTTVAVSLGAPFWFDTLQRFMNIRGGGKKPEADATKEAAAAVRRG